MNEIISLGRLEEEIYGRIICYPNYDPNEMRRRLMVMRKLGVKALCFIGEKKVNNMPVLGKGCVGIVVLAYTDTGKVALKIRRTDAEGSRIKHEVEMLRIANSVDVGPKLLSFSENFLMIEFIDGTLLPKWIETLEDKKDVRIRVRGVLREILEQSWRLDEAGLDHGELSRAPKHIVIDIKDKAYLLDFETASSARKVSNVTSICQYLFMSGKTAESIGKRLGEINREKLLVNLRMYKKNRSREKFEEILSACLT